MKSRKSATRSTPPAARSVALQLLHAVIVDGGSLSKLAARTRELEARERALALELVYGVLRWRWKLEGLLPVLLDKPLKAKEQRLRLILLLALYELLELSTPDYAVVDEAVKLCRRQGRSWASGMINAVLRRFIREREACLAALDSDEAVHAHPQWLIERLRADWPAHWQALLRANNQRPPFWLRVNQQQYEAGAYRSLLQQQGWQASTLDFAEQALLLDAPRDVAELPGFDQGAVSVQDAGAQLAAECLDLARGQLQFRSMHGAACRLGVVGAEVAPVHLIFRVQETAASGEKGVVQAVEAQAGDSAPLVETVFGQ